MALAVTPEGSISLALCGLETLLVNSQTFLAEVGTTSPQDARDSVYFDYLDENEQAIKRPFAIVAENAAGYTQFAGGDRNHLKANGSVVLTLVANARHNSDHKSSKIAFINFAGGVIDDIAALVGDGNYYPFRSVETLAQAERTSPKMRSEGHDFWEIHFGLTHAA